MDNEAINIFAKEHGFAGAILIGKWNRVLVYEAVPKDFYVKYEYIPTLLLVSDSEIRVAEDDEAAAFMDEM